MEFQGPLSMTVVTKCSRCSRPWQHPTIRSCEYCRKKTSESRTGKRESMKAFQGIENFPVVQANTVPPSGSSGVGEKRKAKDVIGPSVERETARAIKSIVGEQLNTDETSSLAYEKILKVFEKRARTHGMEYQTESALYGAFQTATLKKPYHLQGGFSIVKAAGIGHQKKAMQVAHELCKMPQFKLITRSEAVFKWTPKRDMIIVFIPCSCASSKLKKSSQKTAPPYAPPPSDPSIVKCLGEIKIMVQNDISHPIAGIMGQRIDVEVKHP